MACACKGSSGKIKQVKQVSKSVNRKAAPTNTHKRVVRRISR